MRAGYGLSIMVTVTILLAMSSSCDGEPARNEALFISCGQPKSTPALSSSEDNRKWTTDEDLTFSPPDINAIADAVKVTGHPPYDTARLFQLYPLTYTFSLSPGPKLLRLYFTTSTSYNNIPPSQLFLTVQANQLTLFKNFSPFLSSPNDNINKNYEFHLEINNNNLLNLTFSSSGNNNYGFVNAIEILPVPNGLYINKPTNDYRSLSNPTVGYTPPNNSALQTVYRLNVGGSTINPRDDSGSMWRKWELDDMYLGPGGIKGLAGGLKLWDTPTLIKHTITPAYVAPDLLYGTRRIIGDNILENRLRNNLSWVFYVDSGFDYLFRLHFCEMDLNVTGSNQRLFDIYIGSLMAESLFDVWAVSGGLAIPIYKDYVIRVDGGIPTKVPLRLDLHPQDSMFADVMLNGLEILKFSELNGTNAYLAAPNPPQGPQVPSHPSTLVRKESNRNFVPMIIGGTIGGITLVSLLISACLVYKRRTFKKNMFNSKTSNTTWPTITSSTDKWAPLPQDLGSKTSSMSSSLPSDLCRRFSFIQIRIATSDFDESLIIGKGGFGNVYKGSIDGGATTVAIKRLNSTSKQGLNEFQTEIEMLSRLRHVHLVSLIGYCDEQHEMILVYEYMPRGTLRDHLMYKNPQNNNKSPPLSWKQRLQICVGSARGLHYLHAGAKHLIIHRDIKSTNILLDAKWTAKVSDFGLSKVGPDPNPGGSGSTYVSTAVKGSAGYLDPEYYQRHQLTEKSDVYSFGVVLFEVLCARAAVNPNLPKEQANLAMWARSRYKSGVLHTIVDSNLTGQIAPESLRKFGEIADMCVRDRGSERPSMGDVAWGLEFTLQLQETAEKNNISGGGSAEEIILDPTSNNSFSIVATDIINIDEFTTSRDNFYSQSSSVGHGASKRLLDSRSTTSISSDYPVDMKSGSVFSEIIDPKAR